MSDSKNTLKASPKKEFIAGFQPNSLDAFDLVTYNFKLFMVSEANSASGEIFDDKQRIIIAQTGVTSSYSIDDVRISTVAGLGEKNRTGTATKFSFTVTEPLGATFIDQIYRSSLSLGISNYMKVPYYLELSFKGRSEISSLPIRQSDQITSSLSATQWCYAIIITGVEVEVTSSGSIYTISAAPYSQLAQTDQYGIIDKALSFSAKTVGEALDNLQDNINSRQEEKYLASQYQQDKYIFEVNEEIRKYEIIDIESVDSQSPLSDAEIKNRDNTKTSDNTKKIIQINNSTSILIAIENILSASSRYQKEIKHSEDAKDNQASGDNVSTMKKLHTVETEVKILGYDIGRGDYIRVFKYVILPYETGILHSGPSETKNDSGKNRYSEYKKRKLLQKHYQYIYTGQNDQILNVNMKFNFAWFAGIPRQGGIFTDYVQSSAGRNFKSSYKEFKDLKIKIAKYLSNIPNFNKVPAGGSLIIADSNTRLGTIDQVNANAVESDIDKSTLSDAEKQVLKNYLKTERSSRVPTAERDTTALSNGQLLNFAPSARFASDVTIQAAFKNYTNLETVNRVIPLTYIESDPDINLSNAVEGSDSGGRQYVNAMYTQAFSGTSGDLVTLDLEIKGDPFWLGISPLEKIENRSKISSITANVADYESSSTISNDTTAANFILFTLRTPAESNAAGVRPSNFTTSAYNGVYQVITVEHEFSNGKFTQSLSCVVDPLINIDQIETK